MPHALSQFTPGPWTAKMTWGLPDEDWWSILAENGTKEICIAPRLNDETDKANAALIAAAPDLLEALLDLLYNGEDDDCRKAAFAAIAKAEGKS